MEGANQKLPRDFVLRDATPQDLEALTSLRPPKGLHTDRIARPQSQYILAEQNGKPVAFGVIHFESDPLWDRPDHTPRVMDLHVAPNLRSRGIGRRVLRALEQTARQRGFCAVYLQVEPDKNPRALDLYKKLGYQPLATRPYRDLYRAVDDHGNVSESEETVVDMRKLLD